jgi:hypothetical protein
MNRKNTYKHHHVYLVLLSLRIIFTLFTHTLAIRSSFTMTTRQRVNGSVNNGEITPLPADLANVVERDVYDDACDFGQFVVNPCLYIFQAVIRRFSSFKKTGQDGGTNTTTTAHVQQFIYLLAVFGSWTVVFLQVYPLITESIHLGNYHRSVGYGVFTLCVGSWRVACGVDPGNVTDKTMSRYDNYPYDDFLYKKNKICPTLNIRKIARSKYDRRTGRHIPRFDHYCGWLDSPIGEENYRYFLFFLFVHQLMVVYGSAVLYIILRGKAFEAQAETGLLSFPSALVTSFLWRHVWITTALLVMLTTTALLGSFFAFHMWLIYKGLTTNEYYKWKAIRVWHKEATKTYQSALKNGIIVESSSSSEGGGGGQHSSSVNTCYDDEEKNNNDNDKNGAIDPHSSGDSSSILNPGPMPQNKYDRGLLQNIGEVFYPLSFRKSSSQQRQKDM